MPITGSGSGSGGGSPGANGRGIVSVARTSGDGSPGTVDTYTITYTDATTSTFDVHNGTNGTGGGGSGAWTGVENVNIVTSSGATLTLPDVDSATIHAVRLTANCTLTFPAAAAGKSITVQLTQDSTGARAVTWPASVKWSQAIAPILSTAAGKVDLLSFLCINGTTWIGSLVGLDYR